MSKRQRFSDGASWWGLLACAVAPCVGFSACSTGPQTRNVAGSQGGGSDVGGGDSIGGGPTGKDASAGGGRSRGTGSSQGYGGDPDLTQLCTGDLCLSVSNECDASIPISIKSIRTLGRRILGEGTGEGDPCAPKEVTWVAPPVEVDAGPTWTPPAEETYACPKGTVRVHVRDIWSTKAAPTLATMANRPTSVAVIDVKNNFLEYWAQPDRPDCDWYSVCLPTAATSIQLKALGGNTGCEAASSSGTFDVSKLLSKPDLYIAYMGQSTTLKSDFTAYPPPVGPQAFQLTDDASSVPAQCAAGKATDPETIPEGMVKIHIRWPWGDPSVTGFPGTNCESIKLGHSTPPYPSSLKIQGTVGSCTSLQATLDFQDGHCPWYTVLVPESAWTGKAPLQFTFGLPDWTVGLTSADIEVPKPTGNEIWIAYSGPPDNENNQGTQCLRYSTEKSSFHVYMQNPGPGYEHCGGGNVNIDPCSPPPPADYSVVHFRYIWAGQKTFTFFPRSDLMPKWMILEVNDFSVTCTREADRPWFNCPVPNSEFHEGAMWRAVDKTRSPTEWNTVTPRPFAAKPGEYWLRWDYGKPDTTSGEFKLFDYYPDGTNGDWSATGQWKDDQCAPKPPATPVTVGYGYGGWFPYKRTGYAYPFGSSLSHVYGDSQTVQDLLNAFVFQRYERWKKNYVLTDDLTCGEDTARVSNARIGVEEGPTVSEGMGYGIAMAAAIGDRPTFEKLWNMTRRTLSQSAKKYCGGLAGWMLDSKRVCRPLDQPCDPDQESCDGNLDSAFDGDVDIAIGLVYAARQWPEFTEAAVNWLLKMECEVDTAYDGKWYYPTPGDTFNKNCQEYPNKPCTYTPGADGRVNMSYYPPGYFRVFGDFLATYLSAAFYSDADRKTHRDFWYKTAETVYEMYERCYDNTSVNPGLVEDWGTYTAPCSAGQDNYNWSRALWRAGVDAAWFGNRLDLPENLPGSSAHYAPKSRMQAKIDNIQHYYSNFYKDNPPEPNANRFSTLCKLVTPAGNAKGCDPGFDHNSYFVNTAMTAFASVFDNAGATTPAIRREALEEAVSATVENDKYYQESLGVYTMLFLSGNFPNPMDVK